MILQQWSPRFQFHTCKISTLPVWIRLRGLPLPLCTKGLSMAASMVGTPYLVMNRLTIAQEGLSLDNWGHLSNDDGRNPSRILVGWNKATCNLTSIHSSPQWLTCEVSTLNNSSLFRITFIYGQSTPARRVDLWNYITQHHFAFSSKPWLIQGDFNAIMGRNDRSGAFFTKWSRANSNFLFRSISDHSATITMLTKAEIKPRLPIKFLNLWVEKEEFLPMVNATWMEEADGATLCSSSPPNFEGLRRSLRSFICSTPLISQGELKQQEKNGGSANLI
ncbi:hypothetical protein OIU84_029756 [Salix udensis]|uniref:DUF4283 domain-containing protein n=1 Tax=Salix udensis TaxID=889485 RepID=A0AAD6P7G2_9ROSI|nr:hypothetical protein OIU84_029756 [Salix udensis]